MTTTTGRGTRAPSTGSATGARRGAAGAKSKRKPASDQTPGPAERGEVAAAVAADLDLLPPALGKSGLAMACLALAREIDSPANSATSKSMCAKSLQDGLATLRALTPEPESRGDDLDDLAARRAARRAGSAAS